jgi:hypothetical protein
LFVLCVNKEDTDAVTMRPAPMEGGRRGKGGDGEPTAPSVASYFSLSMAPQRGFMMLPVPGCCSNDDDDYVAMGEDDTTMVMMKPALV